MRLAASQQFTVIAPDLFWRAKPGVELARTISTARALRMKTDSNPASGDAATARASALRSPGRRTLRTGWWATDSGTAPECADDLVVVEDNSPAPLRGFPSIRRGDTDGAERVIRRSLPRKASRKF
jgi:hypothetical protein